MNLPPAIRRYAEHPFWQAVGILLLAYVVVVWVVPFLPGSAIVPKSVVLQYMVTVLVGVLIYVSDNEERWRDFKEPIQADKLDGQGQVIAPDLTHVGSRRNAESIHKKILDPASSVTKGYEKLAGIMPKSFGTMMNAAQLEALVQYLAAHK